MSDFDNQFTLGNLIAALKAQPATHDVRFDFGGFIPRSLMSYRGYYDQLALDFDDDYHKPVTVSALVVQLEKAIGKTFEGYKGGTYRMDRDTLMWVAHYGDSNSTGIVGVQDVRWQTVINTAWCE